MITVLHEQSETSCAGARAEGNHLWLDATEFASITGWTLKPEGFCRGDVCVPIPHTRAREFVDGSAVDAAAVWTRMGNAIAHDAARTVWVLGSNASERGSTLRSLDAPAFSLPDLDGQMHALADHRGKKVFLVTWASW